MFFVTLTTPMQKIAKSNESKLFPNGRITENIDGFINTPHYVNRHNIHLFKIINQINIPTCNISVGLTWLSDKMNLNLYNF